MRACCCGTGAESLLLLHGIPDSCQWLPVWLHLCKTCKDVGYGPAATPTIHVNDPLHRHTCYMMLYANIHEYAYMYTIHINCMPYGLNFVHFYNCRLVRSVNRGPLLTASALRSPRWSDRNGVPSKSRKLVLRPIGALLSCLLYSAFGTSPCAF